MSTHQYRALDRLTVDYVDAYPFSASLHPHFVFLASQASYCLALVRLRAMLYVSDWAVLTCYVME